MAAAVRLLACAGAVLAVAGLGAGCATSHLSAARSDFRHGHYDRADLALTEIPDEQTDRVLLLMERGAIRQARGAYEASVRDWQAAVDQADQLDVYSVSRGTASFAVNDRILAFRGAPYERVLLHAFAAKSYLALGMWDDAAVEARNIIRRLENRCGFPDDLYARYLSAFCLEASGDQEGARFQYHQLGRLLPDLHVDEHTGRLRPVQTNSAGQVVDSPAPLPPWSGGAELVCFVSLGLAPTTGHQWPAIRWVHAPYAEFYAGDRYLGRSYALSDTAALQAETRRKLAAMRAAKDITRIVAKEMIADAVSQQNDLLGEILRLILLAMEAPDDRRWETLPQWLEVARVPCPPDLTGYRIVFKGTGNRTIGEKIITTPLARRGKTFVSFCRDLTEVPSLPPVQTPAPTPTAAAAR